MAVKTKRSRVRKSTSAKKAAQSKAAAAIPSSTVAPSAGKSGENPVNNAVPQKALVYAVRGTDPPPISDEVPDAMPFRV